MGNQGFFEDGFRALTGHDDPLGWQRRLFHRLAANNMPCAIDIPTGLGKTSIIALWLLALARQSPKPQLPRRLVYVVNRRTVVDQATDDAEKIRENLRNKKAPEVLKALGELCLDCDMPLAISTLRGEFADNREWQADPARPAIIIGTVDMIGSRLLFSGYGAGWKMRGFNAGLIGHDALLVHDEAHLTPAFGALIRDIENVQQKEGSRCLNGVAPCLSVMELTATQREQRDGGRIFELTGEEKQEDLVEKRFNAAKSLRLHQLGDAEELRKVLPGKALEYMEEKKRVLVYVRSPKDARAVAEDISKKIKDASRVALLTGTLRGKERDELVETRVFKEMRAGPDRKNLEDSLYLISTSAGETGVDFDADHMVCDLTMLDSMIQRLGRVNRLGREPGVTACIDVFDASREKEKPDLKAALDATREALKNLRCLPDDSYDASPSALKTILDEDTISIAFAPTPRLAPCTDILLDAWALTSVRDSLPGRPPVHRWLHGVESNPPETVFIWREEAEDLAAFLLESNGSARAAEAVEEWFEAHRILAKERLRAPSNKAMVDELKKIARRARDGESLSAIILPYEGKPFVKKIDEIDQRLASAATVVLPVTAGGLENGMLSGDGNKHPVEDVADLPAKAGIVGGKEEIRLRVRLERSQDEWRIALLGQHQVSLKELIAKIETEPEWRLRDVIEQLLGVINQGRDKTDHLVQKGPKSQLLLKEDEEGSPAIVLLSLGAKRGALQGSSFASKKQTIEQHNGWAGEAAAHIVDSLKLPPDLASAIVIAASCHDTGKDRDCWQAAIYNRPPRDPRKANGWRPLAKTGHGRWQKGICDGYRHEFGSLIDAAADPAGAKNPEHQSFLRMLAVHPERDLILHLIASHHGRARPHFEERGWDPEAGEEVNANAAAETMRRYARLQRRFGRWGLAWLEALLKSADAMATRGGGNIGDKAS